jgi:hypothetical protein
MLVFMPSPKIDPLLSATVKCRDGGQCVYCGRVIIGGDITDVELSIDHIVPRVWWGARPNLDHPGNLASCCDPCNSLKGTMDEVRFAAMVDAHKASLGLEYAYLQGVTGEAILARVRVARTTPVDFTAGQKALATIKANRRG